jgi:hypothetical protein
MSFRIVVPLVPSPWRDPRPPCYGADVMTNRPASNGNNLNPNPRTPRAWVGIAV